MIFVHFAAGGLVSDELAGVCLDVAFLIRNVHGQVLFLHLVCVLYSVLSFGNLE